MASPFHRWVQHASISIAGLTEIAFCMPMRPRSQYGPLRLLVRCNRRRSINALDQISALEASDLQRCRISLSLSLVIAHKLPSSIYFVSQKRNPQFDFFSIFI
jgi:hypothetical protein